MKYVRGGFDRGEPRKGGFIVLLVYTRRGLLLKGDKNLKEFLKGRENEGRGGSEEVPQEQITR